MFFAVAALIIIAGYVSLELYFRSRNAKVTWIDRTVGGIGGVVALTGLYLFFNNRGELGQPEAYVVIVLSMVSAIGLGIIAWLSITRNLE